MISTLLAIVLLSFIAGYYVGWLRRDFIEFHP